MKYEGFDLENGLYPLHGEDGSAKTLRVWTQPDGQWACVAYDHGPFCRRCVHLDETGASCLALVLTGELRVSDDPVRGMVFHTTDAGRARVETAIRRGGFDKGLDA